MIAALALAMCAQAARAEGIAVEARGGHFRAVLAKAPGQERVADAIARWKLEVSDDGGRVLWSAFHPAPGPTQRFLLAQDGSRFVVVDAHYGDAKAVITLRAGEDVERVFGGQLGMDAARLRAEPQGAWLAEGQDALAFSWMLGPFGPMQMLDVTCFDGVVRRIDLESGLPLDAGGGLVPVLVEPMFEKETVPPSAVPRVLAASAPEEVFGDEGLVLTIEGTHPNPGWRVFAFALEPGGADGRTLIVSPRAKPPMPGGLQVQKEEAWTAQATLRGLPPGEHRIVVQGADGAHEPALHVRVRTGGIFGILSVSGGILGLRERITLFGNGTVAIESNRPGREGLHFAPPRAFATAQGLLTALPALPPGPTSQGADLRQYELSWRVAGRWHQVAGDDGNVRGELRRAIDAVLAVASDG